MTLFSSNPDFGEATEELAARYEGEALNTGFNARYMLDVFERDGRRKDLAANGKRAEPLFDPGGRSPRVQMCGDAN